MKPDNEMPGNDRDYAESDISDNQKQQQPTNHEQQGHSGQSQTNDDQKQEKNAPYIKDMPEIIPARTGII